MLSLAELANLTTVCAGVVAGASIVYSFARRVRISIAPKDNPALNEKKGSEFGREG